jgi:hypothetical protein
MHIYRRFLKGFCDIAKFGNILGMKVEEKQNQFLLLWASYSKRIIKFGDLGFFLFEIYQIGLIFSMKNPLHRFEILPIKNLNQY